MKTAEKRIGLFIFFCLAASSPALAQKADIRIVRAASGDRATPGQLVQLFVDGLRTRTMPAPVEQFEVVVTQDEKALQAQVRMVSEVFVRTAADGSAKPGEDWDIRELLANTAKMTDVLFTVPTTLHEGKAWVVVVYRDQHSDAYALTIVPRISALDISVPGVTFSVSDRPQAGSEPTSGSSRPAPRLERGQETTLLVTPLVDPEVADVALLVTFTQGESRSEATARIIKHDPVEQANGMISFGSLNYEVRVRTPAGLAIGPVEIEVRERVDGELSEPGRTTAQIIDPAEAAGPRIVLVDPGKVGIGQAFVLLVDDPRRLQPDPDSVVVVLEQNDKRVELKPETNAALDDGGPQFMPVMLTVRIGAEITGRATLRIHHPARGAAGLCAPVPIEIAPEVLAPEVRKLAEATKQDLAQWQAVSQKTATSAHPYPGYDRKRRYVTIDAKGLDLNPDHVRVTFYQDGRIYTLNDQDFGFGLGDHRVVRLPDEIKTGTVTVSIQNVAAGQLSKAVILPLEITAAGRQ